jgi:putative restriction endonuclease
LAKDLYVGNTDHEWFDFCKSQGNLDEVNFWQPSRQHFKAIDIGGIFFFRRKSPIDKIGGFGVLASAGEATIQTAWQSLELSNGVETKEDFVDRVRKYKKSYTVDDQTLIGFKILIDPVFLDEEHWIDVPKDWSKNIVSGKSYYHSAIHAKPLLKLFERHKRETIHQVANAVSERGFAEIQSGFKYRQSSKVRVGQSSFRMALLAAYRNKCAITGTALEVCLEAAHITAFSETVSHEISNGLLLRRDIHALFDSHLLSVDSENRIRLSNSLKAVLEVGDEYLQLEGKKLAAPTASILRPSKRRLAEHFSQLKN